MKILRERMLIAQTNLDSIPPKSSLDRVEVAPSR